jgi:lipoate-protein ligase A
MRVPTPDPLKRRGSSAKSHAELACTVHARSTLGSVEELTGEEQIARDEALLARGAPAAYVALLADRCVSLGVGQRDADDVVARAREEGLPVLRRSTGGTTVLCERGDLAWSIVLPDGDPRIGPGFVRAYPRLGAAVEAVLRRLDPTATWGEPPSLADRVCFLSGRGSVLAGRVGIVGGAAQHRTRRGLLHHGLLAVTVDRDRWLRLVPELRRGDVTRLGALSDLEGFPGGRPFAQELEAALGRAFLSPTDDPAVPARDPSR